MSKVPQPVKNLIFSVILNFIDENNIKDEIYNYLPKDIRDDFLYILETGGEDGL